MDNDDLWLLACREARKEVESTPCPCGGKTKWMVQTIRRKLLRLNVSYHNYVGTRVLTPKMVLDAVEPGIIIRVAIQEIRKELNLKLS